MKVTEYELRPMRYDDINDPVPATMETATNLALYVRIPDEFGEPRAVWVADFHIDDMRTYGVSRVVGLPVTA